MEQWTANGLTAISRAQYAPMAVTRASAFTVVTNPDRLRGSYLAGVVLNEFADMSPAV